MASGVRSLVDMLSHVCKGWVRSKALREARLSFRPRSAKPKASDTLAFDDFVRA
jgi:hypothetical protein